jgi:hypothetical protein
MDMTHIVVGLLRAVHTLRIDSFCNAAGAAMCTTVLASKAIRPRATTLMHLALYNLRLTPDDPQLVGAIQGQNKLVVRRPQLQTPCVCCADRCMMSSAPPSPAAALCY